MLASLLGSNVPVVPAADPPLSTWEWVGENWIALVAIVIPIVVGLYLAAKSTRYEMDHRDFARDQEAAATYRRAVKSLYGVDLVGKTPEAGRPWLDSFDRAKAAFLDSTQASINIAGYFTDQYVVFNRALKNLPDETGKVPGSTNVDHALRQLETLVTDWPYPERRRAVYRRVLEDRLSHMPSAGYSVPVGLQIDRWMIFALPSPYPVVQTLRRAWVAVRLFIHGLAHGQAGNWLEVARIGRRERASYRRRVAAEAARARRPKKRGISTSR